MGTFDDDNRGIEAGGAETAPNYDGPITQELRIHSGGDGDDIGVEGLRDRGPTDGSTATSSRVQVKPVEEGAQFPARFDGHCTD